MLFVSRALTEELEYSGVLCTNRKEALIEQLSVYLIAGRVGGRLAAFVGNRIEPKVLQERAGSRFKFPFSAASKG